MQRLILLCVITFCLLSGCSKHVEKQVLKEGKILVLMYHRIVKGETANLYERSAGDFEADLSYLKHNNINVISFQDLEEVSKSGKMPSGNSVILTFDDGDHSWLTIVKPLLLKYKMKATFFLWTYMIGHDSFLAWNEVEDMSYYTLASGERPFTFGSHTYSHSFLLQSKSGFADQVQYNAFLDYELGESKKLIEKHSPNLISALSLPFGDGAGDPDIIAAAIRNGYSFIRTSTWANIINPAINLYTIPGLPVLDTTSTKFINYYLNQ